MLANDLAQLAELGSLPKLNAGEDFAVYLRDLIAMLGGVGAAALFLSVE
jgi:hypothetical protein